MKLKDLGATIDGLTLDPTDDTTATAGTTGLNGLFVLNSANQDLADLVSSSDYAGGSADGDPQVFNSFKNQVQVSFLGFESAFVAIDYDKSKYTTNTLAFIPRRSATPINFALQ